MWLPLWLLAAIATVTPNRTFACWSAITAFVCTALFCWLQGLQPELSRLEAVSLYGDDPINLWQDWKESGAQMDLHNLRLFISPHKCWIHLLLHGQQLLWFEAGPALVDSPVPPPFAGDSFIHKLVVFRLNLVCAQSGGILPNPWSRNLLLW